MNVSKLAGNAMLHTDPHVYEAMEGSPVPSPRHAEAEPPPMPLDEIAALVTSSRNAAANVAANETKPRLTVSASGRFQDQFYHAQEGSRAMGKLKNRALVKQTAEGQRSDGAKTKRKKSVNVNGRDVEQFSDADIVYAGYLIKQGSFWKTWRRRYFILRRDVNVLVYYTSQENLVKLGEIVIDATTKVTAPKPNDTAFPGRFTIEHGGRKLVLVAEDGRSAAETWTLVIDRCISTRASEAAVTAARGSQDRESLRTSLLQMRMSANGSNLASQQGRASGNGSNLVVPPALDEEKPLSASASPSPGEMTATESPSSTSASEETSAGKMKRNSTDSRVIQAAAEEAALLRSNSANAVERERFIRSARLKSIDSANDSARKLLASTAKSVTTVTNRGVIARPPPRRLFRSYSAGSVLSTRSMSFHDVRGSHDDSGLRTSLLGVRSEHPDSSKQLRHSDAHLDDRLASSKTETRARNLSLPGFRPVPSIELSISVGCRGAQETGHMLVVLTAIVPEERGDAKELARTEVQGSLALRSCGGDFFVRDFNALLSVPLSGMRNAILQFEIYSMMSLSSETLTTQQSLGFVRIPHVDLLFSGDSTLVLECLRSRQSPSKQVHFLVIDRIRPSETLNIGHSYTYAKRHFVADIVPFDKRLGAAERDAFYATVLATPSPTAAFSDSDPARKASASVVSRGSSSSNSLSYGDMMRGNLDSSDATQVLISEELSSSYCSISVAVKYIKLVQQRNQRRIHDAHELIEGIERKYEQMPSSPNSRTESADIINLHSEMIRDADARIEYYRKLHEAYVGCEDYYEVLMTMLEEGKEPGITGCLKRSTQKKDKTTEFMPTNLNCHVVRARRVTLSGDNKTVEKVSREVKAVGAKGDELVYAVVTHGCPAAHCLGFKDGGLRRLKQTISQAVKEDSRTVERIEQRQDVVRCQILAIASAAFLTVIGLAANHSARHQERLQLMCQTGFLLSMESLLSTIKNEKGMIEDMAEGIQWLNSSVSLQVVQSMEVDPKLKSAKCVAITSAENGDNVVATFALPSEVFATLPDVLRHGHAIKVHALLFTQGINEMQSVANTVLDTSLQDEINQESVTRLMRFFQLYKTHVLAMQPPNQERIKDLTDLEIEIKILAEKLNLARKSHVQRKNVNILIESSDLCRRLGAGRTTCCKSGKDRTAMSVTLECSRLLVDRFHVKQGVHLCNAMRERGVRRVNVLANTGKNKFAFNSFQLKYLPDCYRPPVLTADSKVQS